MSKEFERQLRLRQAYKRTFSTEDGQLVLDDLKARCGYENSVFNENPYVLACKEGGRAVLCYILEMMNVDKLFKR